jgi:hypothetical protein
MFWRFDALLVLVGIVRHFNIRWLEDSARLDRPAACIVHSLGGESTLL